MSGALDPELTPIPTADRRAATLGAIAGGGALGGLARYALATAAAPGGGIPWPTLAVNVVGALAVGVLATRIAHGRTSERLRPFAITGICGGLTTFSTVMTEANLLARGGRPGLAGAYLALTLAAGFAAAAVGTRLATAR